jgi:hypothetical protein
MAVGNFCFWLAETLKICKDETIGPNDFWHIANDICEVYFKDSMTQGITVEYAK